MEKQNTKSEPLAIVGMGCRFPGNIDSPESFWKAIYEGKDGITEVPTDRWDLKTYYHPDRSKPGKTYTRRGGFLADISHFDPQFFGISPREASFLDPQQRLLLETTWEALEDAGIKPEDLSGENVGIYIGLFIHDYENMHTQPSEHNIIGTHSATGMSTTIAANRISYTFNFKGPSMVVDTACSSSLVAIHLACQSILNNESSMAIAGGVNVISRPEMTMTLSKGSFLSEDGACKSFDSRANGYVRSEGVGMIVIKKLSDALKDKDPIYALIQGTDVNHDGKSNGITVPSMEAQIKGLRKAVTKAGIKPNEVKYVEAHGTGTIVGDPIEAEAIGTVFSENRPEGEKVIVGSIKSNIGHTESAAGVAGIMKVALCVQHGIIPTNLHFLNPNPQIPFEELKLRVPTSTEKWPDETGKSRYAAINAFGFGGTNAHAIVECFETSSYYKSTETGKQEEEIPAQKVIVPISAHSEPSLKEIATSYLDFLKSEKARNISIVDFARSASIHKGHHPNRLSIVTDSKDKLIQYLESYLSEEKRMGMATRQVLPNPKLAFVFSGMGPQWLGMGRRLFEEEPIFRKMIEKCDLLFKQHTTDWSLIGELMAEEKLSHINETQITQPCLFSVQVALFELWKSWGITPEAVVGHSVGEMAACYAAGVLSLEDLVKVCFHRSRLQKTCANQGSMLAVGISAEEVKTKFGSLLNQISIAAINSPGSVTLSGDTQIIKEIEAILVEENIFARILNVEVPYHSAYMNPILPELKESLKDLKPKKASIPLISTVTGNFIDGTTINAEYWTKNVRESVLFQKAVKLLIKTEHNIFIEISAHPVLSSSINECLSDSDTKGATIASMRRNEDDSILFRAAFGELYTTGHPVNWNDMYRDKGSFVRLPSYKWVRDYYWKETEESSQIRLGKRTNSGQGLLGQQIHPLLGSKIDSALPSWNLTLDLNDLSYLNDHQVQGSIVFPGAAYMEIALAAAKQQFGDSFVVENIAIKAPLILSDQSKTNLQLSLDKENNFTIHSKEVKDNQEWTLHSTGHIGRMDLEKRTDIFPLQEIKERLLFNEKTKEECYKRLKTRGLEYGPMFQPIENVWIGSNEILGRIIANNETRNDLDAYLIHPIILDACFQVMASAETNGTYLPVKVEYLRVYKQIPATSWCYASFEQSNQPHITGDIILLDDEGNRIAEIRKLHCQRIDGTQNKAQEALDGIVFQYEWKQEDHPSNRIPFSEIKYPNTPTAISKKMSPEVDTLMARNEKFKYHELVSPQLNELSVQYIAAAFEKLGWNFNEKTSFSEEEIFKNFKITKNQQSFLHKLLQILEENEILIEENNRWLNQTPPNFSDIDTNWHNTLAEHPSYLAELTLLTNCASELADLLSGKLDPTTILLSKNTISASEHFYQSAPTYRMYNQIVQRTTELILSELPREKTLHILDVGGSKASIALYLLPLLPAHRVTYTITDTTELLLETAKNKFSKYPFVSFKTFNLNEELSTQKFNVNAYDMVIASDISHAKGDTKTLLAKISSLLIPGGYAFFDQQPDTPWYNLIFGIQPNYWSLPKIEIPKSDAPHDLFSESGFHSAIAIPSREGDYMAEQNLILAQKRMDEDLRIATNDEMIPSSEEIKYESCILFADENELSENLILRLKKSKIDTTILRKGSSFAETGSKQFTIRPNKQEDYNRILSIANQATNHSPLVIYLWNISYQETEINNRFLKSDLNDQSMPVIYLAQAITSNEWKNTPNLWIVTNGLQLGNAPNSNQLCQAPIVGISRVLVSEYVNLDTRLIDLSLVPLPNEIDLLWHEILHPTDEDELAYRKSTRYIKRLVKNNESHIHKISDTAFELNKESLVGFDKITFVEKERVSPGEEEVEINIKAAGLNFKDLAKLTGLLDDTYLAEEGKLSILGLDCAGIITAVGKKVSKFKIGDEVMGIASNCFSSYILANPKALVKKPTHINFEEASAIPTTFLTAHYALNELCHIQKGERVLIHTATGGVGLAVIQVALNAGAEVLATAGTPEKRKFLRAMGIQYVGDSRSDKFIDEVQTYTNNTGVDVIINTLPSRMVAKSMCLLKQVTGKFIDLTNVYEPSLTISSLSNGVSFHSFDMESMLFKYPQLADDMLGKIAQQFEERNYHAIPFRTFPISDISEALLYMRKGVHIGKIVISLDDACIKLIPSKSKLSLNENATYLITGGLGGFGMATAQWLVESGARHLVLIGRSGASTEEARQGVLKIEKTGAQVVVKKADITNEEQLKAVLNHIKEFMPPLKGVLHAAMVLEDSSIANMSHEKFEKVMNPKVVGAWNLHTNTLDEKLDFFLFFSSFVAIVGNQDQANYSAANMFLNSLAHYRKNLGLPATSINWGVIGEVGFVSKHDEIKDLFLLQGMHEISLHQAWMSIVHGIEKNQTEISIIPGDWQRMSQYSTSVAKSPRFSLQFNNRKNEGDATNIEEGNTLFSGSSDERKLALQEILSKEVANVLGVAKEKMDIDQALGSLGFDSLMAVELVARIKKTTGISLPKMTLLKAGLNVSELVEIVNSNLNDVSTKKKTESKTSQEIENKWVVRQKIRKDASMRLFCFPYLGGGASVFDNWADSLPDEIELCAIQLPGRENRSHENAINDMQIAIAELAKNILPLLDKPFAFYGHSIGARLSINLAIYLQKNYQLKPAHLFGGSVASDDFFAEFMDEPHGLQETEMPDRIAEQIINKLENSEALLKNTNALNEMMPAIKADSLLGISMMKYGISKEPEPAPSNITLFQGDSDKLKLVTENTSWDEFKINSYKLVTVPGGHLFFNEHNNKQLFLNQLSILLQELIDIEKRKEIDSVTETINELSDEDIDALLNIALSEEEEDK